MDPSEFEAALLREGYTEVARRSLPPSHPTQPHHRPFDVRAVVLDGAITLVVAGEATSYRSGQTFVMAQGREHAESVGPDGVTTLSGRRYTA